MSASDRKEDESTQVKQVKKESIIPRAYTGAPAPRPAPLTAEQEKAYGIVLERFGSEEYRIVFSNESGKEGEGEALMAQERFWLSRECILRYLRATKWVVPDAISRLEATLKWRREYGLTSFLTAEHVEPEGKTGKIVVYGYDASHRPSIYLLPSRQNTDVPAAQLQYTFWNIERAIDLMEGGVESLVLLIDFADKAKNPSISTARTMLSILQNHYPERLGAALIINIPYLVKMFLNIMLPFVDPTTRAKIHLNPTPVPTGLYAPEQITSPWGGTVSPTYEHASYWPGLVGVTEERREGWVRRWEERSGGVGKVGGSEWEYKEAPTKLLLKRRRLPLMRLLMRLLR